jgi:CO dehydrogenase/acetyl-CoA synthase epsilon subunit
MAISKKDLEAKLAKDIIALALAQVNVDKALAAVDGPGRATKAQMTALKNARAILVTAHNSVDQGQIDLLPKVLKKYRFSTIKVAGTHTIATGKGFLRHIIYNAPLVHTPDVILIDGVGANDVLLPVNPNTTFPSTTIDGTVIVPNPESGHGANKYVLEYHTPFARGLVVVLQMDRDITVVWEPTS